MLFALIIISILLGAFGGRYIYTIKGRRPLYGTIIGALTGVIPPLMLLFLVVAFVTPNGEYGKVSVLGAEIYRQLEAARALFDSNAIDADEYKTMKQKILTVGGNEA